MSKENCWWHFKERGKRKEEEKNNKGRDEEENEKRKMCKQKKVKKNKVSEKKWDNMKHTYIHIMGVPEGEKRKK